MGLVHISKVFLYKYRIAVQKSLTCIKSLMWYFRIEEVLKRQYGS